MGIEIKVLGPGDVGLLESVAPEVFDDPIDPERAREFLDDPRHHLVAAVDGGKIVGFVSAVHYVHPDKPSPELWINEVGVAPTHQGRGVGKALMRATLDLGRRLGCGEAWVLTERSNTPARKLYATSGGVEASEDVVMFDFYLDSEPDGA